MPDKDAYVQKLHAKLDDLRQAGEGAWEDLKSGVESAWGAMEGALKSTRNRFK